MVRKRKRIKGKSQQVSGDWMTHRNRHEDGLHFHRASRLVVKVLTIYNATITFFFLS